MYDVIIVGGGPAGATLARLIGKDYKVLLLEKRDFTGKKGYKREKCCGGLIAHDAQLMLAKFKLGLPKSVLLSPQLFVVRTLDFDNSNERYYQRNYINMDREKFDEWLISLIPPDVKIINGSIYKSFNIDSSGVTVRFYRDCKEYEEKAKILVGADGAFSNVRRQGFSNYHYPKVYITIQEWFKTDCNSNYYGAIFDKEITDFYSWTIPKEDYLIVGSALRPNDRVREKFQLLKDKLKNHGFKLENSTKTNGAYLYRPVNSNQICIGDNKIALIGEAAGYISPSSAEGLSYAFRSSLALAKALKNDFDNYQNSYSANTKALWMNIKMKNMKSIAMYNSCIRNLIMKTGVLSVGVEKMGNDFEI